ncbi:MAG: CHAD domain-containing protein, partial [Ktedonobacteraceae bacterium]|nr:CHAD domain-containing protein [Ktedonobacteraceae bacterium]
GATIDIGSNTLHLVVVHYTPNDLDIVADEVDMVRIGESVTATGEISQQKLEDTVAALQQYRDIAAQHKADPVLVVATEAIRKAKNSAEFVEDVYQQTGLATKLINGNVEAVLTFYGATYEVHKEDDQASKLVGVMDLGGGSTELVLAKQKQLTWHTSLPIGSGWLHDQYLHSDPPTHNEVLAAETFLQSYFEKLPSKRYPPALIVTGGSANSLLGLARSAFHLDAQGDRLLYEDVIRCEGVLSALSAEEIASRYNQPLGRARILPAGALIIRIAMSQFGLREIRVSPHGIREGALLAYARYGSEWLLRVEKEAKQQKQLVSSATATTGKNGMRTESFAQSGQRLLQERTHKLLEWRDEVLKHEDVEAVHKMRVATRHVRAVLDAYQSIYPTKPFKKLYRSIKDLADALGNARDTDVMIENLQAQLEHVPSEEQVGVHWLVEHLKVYRRQRQGTIEEFFADLDGNALKAEIDACQPKKGG